MSSFVLLVVLLLICESRTNGRLGHRVGKNLFYMVIMFYAVFTRILRVSHLFCRRVFGDA